MTHSHSRPGLSAAADREQSRRLTGPISVDRGAAIQDLRSNAGRQWIRGCISAVRGPERLTIDEYLYYRLYANDYVSSRENLYIGKNTQEAMHRACNSAYWYGALHDKVLFQTILQAAGLPRPHLAAAYGERIGTMPTWQSLTSIEALKHYLGSAQNYPVFAKPIDGQYSLGAMLLRSVADNQVTLGDGSSYSVEALAAYIDDISDRGYLFQKPLRPHETIKATFGDVLPSARIMVLMTPGKLPQIHTSTLKIPIAEHNADNFWRSGNLLSPIDTNTGTLGPAVSSDGQHTHVVTEHPDTALPIQGFALPDWQVATESVLRAAPHFACVRTQGWDVCFTSQGPILLELNFGGDLNLHQLAHGQGFLDARYREHLLACGYSGKLARKS